MRSAVLNEPPAYQSRYDEPLQEPELSPPRKGFEKYEPARPPFGFEDPSPMSDESFGPAPQSQAANYDIIDRLNIIESQLQAIRSQTETINERLKNMEMRLGQRRY